MRAAAGDPHNVGVAAPARVEPRRDGPVDGERALAPARDQHHRTRAIESEAGERRPAPRRVRYRDRVAGLEHGRLRPRPKVPARLGEPQIDVSRPPSEPAHRESRIGVLLLHSRRQATVRRQPHDRSRGVAAGPDHGGGPLGGEEAAGLEHQARTHDRPADVAPPGTAVDRLGGEQVVAKIAGGKDAGLDSPSRADQYGLEMRGVLRLSLYSS